MSENGLAVNIWKPLLICPHAELSRKLSAVWHATAQPETLVESPCYLDGQGLQDLILGHSITLCFVDVGTDQEVALGLVHAVSATGIPVVALHTANDPDLILNCLRQGAVEFLYTPFSVGSFRAALDRLAKRSRGSKSHGSAGGQVYGFMRGKSGSGSTTLACNLAFQLHTLTSRKVLLADLDPLTGTIAFLLKLNSTYSFVHALTNSGRLDEVLWRGMVTPSRGVDVLLSPETPADLVYEPQDVTAMITYWREMYEFTVLDIPGPHDEWGLSNAKSCDELLLVTTNELTAVHATQITLARLEFYGVMRSKIKLIVNRYNTDIGLSSEAIESALELRVFHLVPSDFAGLQKAMMEGKPVATGTNVGRSISELAEKLTGRTPTPRKHTLFGDLWQRRPQL